MKFGFVHFVIEVFSSNLSTLKRWNFLLMFILDDLQCEWKEALGKLILLTMTSEEFSLFSSHAFECLLSLVCAWWYYD